MIKYKIIGSVKNGAAKNPRAKRIEINVNKMKDAVRKAIDGRVRQPNDAGRSVAKFYLYCSPKGFIATSKTTEKQVRLRCVLQTITIHDPADIKVKEEPIIFEKLDAELLPEGKSLLDETVPKYNEYLQKKHAKELAKLKG